MGSTVTSILWSFLVAVLGLGVSRWGAAVLARRTPSATPRAMWVAGLPALLPAWFLPFVSLLNATEAAQGPPRKAFMVASAAAILGVLGSDWLIGREEKRPPGGRPLVGWLLGAGALVPAWLVALVLAARLPR